VARFTREITAPTKSKNNKLDMTVIILSAGIGSRIKSNEPRSLIKIGTKTLLEHQIDLINNNLNNHEIIGVFGYAIEKIIRKVYGKVRVVENQLYENTNNSESLRLAVNNASRRNIMFFHGDLYFNDAVFKYIDFKKSFLVVDRKEMMKSKEIGVTIQNNKATILSYGLPTKWCQIAFITGKELKILRNVLSKLQGSQKKMLSFEVINKMISMGANFECYEPNNMSIIEIDCIKDIKNENFNL
jgi:choline kinase